MLYKRWSKDIKPINWDINNRPRRQDKNEQYVENGAFYITKKENLIKSNLRYSGNIGIVEMPFEESFQIDNKNDLKLLQLLQYLANYQWKYYALRL